MPGAPTMPSKIFWHARRVQVSGRADRSNGQNQRGIE
jgi:hypothetical protein